ncbi:protein rcc2 like protein [Quercus suber]|uniref:Protein rcc2 like protein n=1 Tax=Quercus suber TaxID=58331 RepID=A0AAW0JUX0_QUESU
MAAVEAEKKVEVEEEQEKKEKAGELLFCGGTCWDAIGRRKGSIEGNLVSPTRLRPLLGVNIRFVATGCGTKSPKLRQGEVIQWWLLQMEIPSLLAGTNMGSWVQAPYGMVEIESSPVRCLVSDVKNTACGADFTVWLSSVEGASILYDAHRDMGMHNYNTKDSSVRLAYEAQPRPKAIASLAGETIVKVACGANHTVAVDSNGFVYTWGFGGYGRLGHREQKDEWSPRRVDVFQRHNVLPPDAVVSAGSVNSACTAAGGQLYMWGKIKTTGDDWMYPKPLMDLSGWNIRCMDSGSMHHFVGADSSCISWGHAQYGELGFGPTGQKSSATPKKVDILEGMHVISVACGSGLSMVIVDRTNAGDRLDQLDVYDGKGSGEGSEEPESKTVAKQTTKKGAAKASNNSKKRKKSKDSSDSEDEESDDDDSENGEEQSNGQAEKKSQGGKGSNRGQGKGAAKPVRGRGRPPSANKSSQPPPQVKTGKRGRPRKS